MTLINKNNYREGVKLAPPIKQVSVLSFEKQADNKIWYIIKVTPIPTTTQVYMNDNIKRPHRQRKSYLIARTYEDFYYLDQKLHSEFSSYSMNLQQQLFGLKNFSQMIFFNNSNTNLNNNDPIKKNNQHDHFPSYILPKLKLQRKKSFSLFPKLKINQQYHDHQPKEHHYFIEKLYELQRYCELLLKAPTDITKSLTVLEFFGLNKADTERIVFSSTAAFMKSSSSTSSSSFHVTPKQPPTSTKLTSVPTSSPTLSSISTPHPLSLVSPSPSQISVNEIKNNNNNVIVTNKNASMPNLLKSRKKNKKKKIEIHTLDTFLPLSSMESVLSEDEEKESNSPKFINPTQSNNNHSTIYSSKPTWKKNNSSTTPSTPPLSPTLLSSKYSCASSTITSSTSSSSFSHQLPYFMMMMSSPPLPSSSSPPPNDFPFTKKGNPSKSVLPAHGNTSATKHKVLQQNKQNKQYKQSKNNKQQNRFPSSLPVPLYDTNNTKQQSFQHDQLMQLDNNKENDDNDDLIIIDNDDDDNDDQSSFYLHKRKPLRPSLKSLSTTLSTNFSLLTNNSNNSNNNNNMDLKSASILSKINNHHYSPSPNIKLKVVYDLDNIIMIQVPRTIKLPELRATILHKFDEIAADLPVDFKLVFNSHSSSFSSISSNNFQQLLQQQQQSDILRPSSPLSAAYSTYAHLDNRTIIESQEDLKSAMSTWSALTKVSVRCVI